MHFGVVIPELRRDTYATMPNFQFKQMLVKELMPARRLENDRHAPSEKRRLLHVYSHEKKSVNPDEGMGLFVDAVA